MPDVIDPNAPQKQAEPTGDQVDRLAETWGIDKETAALMMKYKRAQAMTGQGMPQGRMMGRQYVAPGPAEYAAWLVNQVRGRGDEEAVERAIGGRRGRAPGSGPSIRDQMVDAGRTGYDMYGFGSTPLEQPSPRERALRGAGPWAGDYVTEE